jgi:hypothetical protein
MLRFLLALAGSLGFAALIAVYQRAGPAMSSLWRAALIGIASLLALVGLALGIAGLEFDQIWAAVVGLVVLLMAARVGWSARRRKPRPGESRSGLPSTADLFDPRWRSFERMLGAPDQRRARRAQASIRGFLAERNSPGLSAAHQSLLLSLERRVPELLDACHDRCHRATPEERRHYLDGTLERLEQIGRQAEVAREEVRGADDQRLEVLHRYFDGVAESHRRPELPKP